MSFFMRVKKHFEKKIETPDANIQKLTPRENDVFLLLLKGRTLKETAQILNIKYSTANTHATSVYKKLGVNSRAELIIRYHTNKEEPL